MARRRADACYRELGAELRKRRIAANLTMRELDAIRFSGSAANTSAWAHVAGLVRILCTRSRRPASAGREEARPAGGATGAVLSRANAPGVDRRLSSWRPADLDERLADELGPVRI